MHDTRNRDLPNRVLRSIACALLQPPLGGDPPASFVDGTAPPTALAGPCANDSSRLSNRGRCPLSGANAGPVQDQCRWRSKMYSRGGAYGLPRSTNRRPDTSHVSALRMKHCAKRRHREGHISVNPGRQRGTGARRITPVLSPTCAPCCEHLRLITVHDSLCVRRWVHQDGVRRVRRRHSAQSLSTGPAWPPRGSQWALSCGHRTAADGTHTAHLPQTGPRLGLATSCRHPGLLPSPAWPVAFRMVPSRGPDV